MIFITYPNPNHFYVICRIIQNEWNLVDIIYNSCFAWNPTHYNLHLVNNLNFWHAFNSPIDVGNFRQFKHPDKWSFGMHSRLIDVDNSCKLEHPYN